MAKLTTSLQMKGRTFSGRTYKIFDDKIAGFIEEREALKQTIHKTLETEQYEYPIYSFDYGIAWKELVGQERAYVRAEMKRMIQEALLTDSRITDVDGFDFSFSGDACKCTFHVGSVYGEMEIETEVQI
ncbi:MAG: DUF2634 domain-containing protein [Lacrimispora sp.]|uniref:DUF2634 domain-containing protein n=1 Tax=Lacrimispora sp. TaxID=2719234 RepID=UPI0039E5B682